MIQVNAQSLSTDQLVDLLESAECIRICDMPTSGMRARWFRMPDGKTVMLMEGLGDSVLLADTPI